MALFFDAEWFDAKLAEAGLTRAELAGRLALGEDDIAAIWKDQRELAAHDVAAIAAAIHVAPEDVARHAGVSTPAPTAAPRSLEEIGRALAGLDARLARLERAMSELKTLLIAQFHRD